MILSVWSIGATRTQATGSTMLKPTKLMAEAVCYSVHDHGFSNHARMIHGKSL